jgi:hypothetical protein
MFPVTGSVGLTYLAVRLVPLTTTVLSSAARVAVGMAATAMVAMTPAVDARLTSRRLVMEIDTRETSER